MYHLKYGGSGNLDSAFFDILKDSISNIYINDSRGNYYLVELEISRKNELSFVGIFSPQENTEGESR